MKIFLINRSDVLLFSDDKKLKVGKENGREYIDAPVLPDGRIVLRAIRKPELSHSNWWFYESVNPNSPIQIGGFMLYFSG